MKVVQLEIDKIDQTENTRSNYSGLEGLMSALRQRGLLEPIAVVPSVKEGRFVCIYGNRRLMAAKKLGWTIIDAIIKHHEEENEMLMDNLVENIQREDVSFTDQGRGFLHMIEKNNLTIDEVAARVGKDVKYVSTAIDLYKNVPKEFRKKVKFIKAGSKKHGAISVSVAREISNIVRKGNVPRSEVFRVYEYAQKENVNLPNVKEAMKLMGLGISFNEAVKKTETMKRVTVDFYLTKEDIVKLEKLSKKSVNALIVDVVNVSPLFKGRLKNRRKHSIPYVNRQKQAEA